MASFTDLISVVWTLRQGNVALAAGHGTHARQGRGDRTAYPALAYLAAKREAREDG